MAKIFEFDKFKNEYIAVHCKTLVEYDDFLEKCNEAGLNFRTKGNLHTMHSSDTCIVCTVGCFLLNTELSHIKDSNRCTILEWSDYMKKEFSKTDLKPGMVIQYRSGDLRMVMEISDGELHLIGASSHTELKDFKDDLTVDWGDSNCDIIFVYSLSIDWEYALTIGTKGRTVLFERKEPLKMTVEEAEAKLSELLEKEIKIEDE